MSHLDYKDIRSEWSENMGSLEAYILILSQIPTAVLEHEDFHNTIRELTTLVDMAYERELGQDYVKLYFKKLPDREAFGVWINVLVNRLRPQSTREVTVRVEHVGRCFESNWLNEWTVDDVTSWLRNLNPEFVQYCAAFRQEAVDGAKLVQMTAETLKTALGVWNSSHRLHIMKEIEAKRKDRSRDPRESMASENSKYLWIPRTQDKLSTLFESNIGHMPSPMKHTAFIHQTPCYLSSGSWYPDAHWQPRETTSKRATQQYCSPKRVDKKKEHVDKKKEFERVGLISGSVKTNKSFLSVWGIMLLLTAAFQLITAMVLYNSVQDRSAINVIVVTLQILLSGCLSIASWYFVKKFGEICLADMMKFYFTTILWFAGLYLMVWCFDGKSVVVQDEEIWEDGLEMMITFISLSTQIQSLVFLDQTYCRNSFADVLILIQLILATLSLSIVMQHVMELTLWERNKPAEEAEIEGDESAHFIHDQLNHTPLSDQVRALCPRLQRFWSEVHWTWILPEVLILSTLSFVSVYFISDGSPLEETSSGSCALASFFSVLEFSILYNSWKRARNAMVSMEPWFFLRFIIALSLFWAGIYFLIEASSNGTFQFPGSDDSYYSKIRVFIYFSFSIQLHHGSGVNLVPAEWFGQVPVIIQLLLSTPCMAVLLIEAFLWIPSIKSDSGTTTKLLASSQGYGSGSRLETHRNLRTAGGNHMESKRSKRPDGGNHTDSRRNRRTSGGKLKESKRSLRVTGGNHVDSKRNQRTNGGYHTDSRRNRRTNGGTRKETQRNERTTGGNHKDSKRSLRATEGVRGKEIRRLSEPGVAKPSARVSHHKSQRQLRDTGVYLSNGEIFDIIGEVSTSSG